MSAKRRPQIVKTLLILLLGWSFSLSTPSTAFAQTFVCSQVSSFQSASVTSNSVQYFWIGATASLAGDLTVNVNGNNAFSGQVIGNTTVINLSQPLVDGNIVEATLSYTCENGSSTVLNDVFTYRIVATSQPVLRSVNCNVSCQKLQFCKPAIEELKLTKIQGIESILFDKVELCTCLNNDDMGGKPTVIDCVKKIIDDLIKNPIKRESADPCHGIGSSECEDTSIYTNTIELPDLNHNIYAYPNPFRTYINVEISDQKHTKGTFLLRDINGKIVHRQTLRNTGMQQINLSHIPNGVYWIQLTSQPSYLQKVVKVW